MPVYPSKLTISACVAVFVLSGVAVIGSKVVELGWPLFVDELKILVGRTGKSSASPANDLVGNSDQIAERIATLGDERLFIKDSIVLMLSGDERVETGPNLFIPRYGTSGLKQNLLTALPPHLSGGALTLAKINSFAETTPPYKSTPASVSAAKQTIQKYLQSPDIRTVIFDGRTNANGFEMAGHLTTGFLKRNEDRFLSISEIAEALAARGGVHNSPLYFIFPDCRMADFAITLSRSLEESKVDQPRMFISAKNVTDDPDDETIGKFLSFLIEKETLRAILNGRSEYPVMVVAPQVNHSFLSIEISGISPCHN